MPRRRSVISDNDQIEDYEEDKRTFSMFLKKRIQRLFKFFVRHKIFTFVAFILLIFSSFPILVAMNYIFNDYGEF